MPELIGWVLGWRRVVPESAATRLSWRGGHAAPGRAKASSAPASVSRARHT
jgi:hypothetical protein